MYRKPLTTEELIGTQFGRLTIIGETERYIEPSGSKERVMLLECSCGNKHKAQLNIRHN